MHNEVLARAITEIDDALIATAHEKPAGIRMHKNQRWRAVFAVAACLALLFSGVRFHQWQTKLDILVDGNALFGQTVVLEVPAPASPDTRKTMPDSVTVPIAIAANSKVTIAATDGTIAVYDAQTNALLGDGTLVTASGNLTVAWTVTSPAEHTLYTLKINTCTLVLSYMENNWVITQQP